jgi:PST family polysaccharide transporter
MTEKQGLASKSRRAFSWYYSGAIVRIGLSFGTNVLLARLLGPVPFGQMAFVLIVLSIGNLFANIGVPSAIVQKRTISVAEIRLAFTVQMIVGCGITSLIFVASPMIAGVFGQPSLILLLRVASPVFILQIFGSTSTALLQRAHDARTLQVVYVLSYIVAYLGIGIPLAITGHGVWSLVAAQLLQVAVNSLILYGRVRHSLIPRLARDSTGLLSFGMKMLAANLCNWGILNLDNAFVGRFAGALELGLYSRAFSLAQTPAEAVSSSLQQVIFPSASQFQDDRNKLANVHAALFGLVLLALWPIFSAVAAVPDVVVGGLYGTRWLGAVPLFQPLALAIPFYSAMAISGSLLSARGKPQVELVCQFLTLLVAIPVYFIAVNRSVLTLAWAVLAVYIARCILLTSAMLRESGGNWRILASVSWPAAAVGSVSALVAVGVRQLSMPLQPVPRTFAVVISVAAVTLATLIIFSRTFLGPMAKMAPKLVELLPHWFRFSAGTNG